MGAIQNSDGWAGLVSLSMNPSIRERKMTWGRDKKGEKENQTIKASEDVDMYDFLNDDYDQPAKASKSVSAPVKLGTPNLNASKVLNWNLLFDKMNPDVQTSTKSLIDPVGGACLIDPIEKVKAWNGSKLTHNPTKIPEQDIHVTEWTDNCH